MRTVIAVAGVLLLTGVALAQERVPQQEAQRYGKLFAEHAAKLEAPAQVKVEPDPEKACAIRKEGVAALVMPDKMLSADALGKVGKDVVPVGQLWMRNMVPAVDGKAAANDKLRIVKVAVNNEDHPLPLSLLGVRKKGDGLELVIYGKDKEPLLALPLEKADAKQELPIELEGKKNDNDPATGILTINLFGKYQAKLTVAKPEG
jgi:hypothetical protein